MNSHINLQLAKSPREKFHTLPPETTAGTHSCQKRNLMKEKQRKSRGFCSHTHTPHTDMAQKQWRFPSLPINVGMYQSSHNRASETPQARQMLAKLKSEIQQIKPFRYKCDGGKIETVASKGSPHMLMKVCTPKTAHMRPRQLKPQLPPGPPWPLLAPTPPLSPLTPTLPDKSLMLFCEWRYLCRAADAQRSMRLWCLGKKKKNSAVEELSFSFYTSNGEVNVSKDKTERPP